MIIEIWGGPRDGDEIEVPDDARYYHLVRPLDRHQLMKPWCPENDLDAYMTSVGRDYYDTLIIRKYMREDGVIVKKAVWPGMVIK